MDVPEGRLVLSSSLLSSAHAIFHCPVCLRERGELIRYAPCQRHCVICQCEALEPLETAAESAPLPSPDEILADPAASGWLKNALRAAMTRDPVDAANDAEWVFRLLERRARHALSKN
jgi:hypothetical protein